MQSTINPYSRLEPQFRIGMDYIITNIPTITIDGLVSTVHAYINTLGYFPVTPQTDAEVTSVAYNAIDDYSNAVIPDLFSEEQGKLIYTLIGPPLTEITTVDTIADRITDVESNINNRNLSTDEQTPLFIATKLGLSANTYWRAKIIVPGLWAPYLSTSLVSAETNLPYWIIAAMEGALLGESVSSRGLIDPTTDIIINKIVSSLIYALIISAGKVIFQWIPRVQAAKAGDPGVVFIPRDYSTARALPLGSVKTPPDAHADLRTLKVDGFVNILGQANLEDALLQYAVANKIYQLQLYDLYTIFGSAPVALSDFLFKARSAPYFIRNIGCIMGAKTDGFSAALTFNAGQPVRERQFNVFNKESEFWFGHIVDFQIIGPVTTGELFTITLNGMNFSYTAVPLDGIDEVAIGLAAAITAPIFNPPPVMTNGASPPHQKPGGVLEVAVNFKSVAAVTFADLTITYSFPTGNIQYKDTIRDSFDEWMSSLEWLKPQLQPWQYTSAYLQNNTPVWGATEANRMVAKILSLTTGNMVDVIDTIEATNYTADVLPDPPYEIPSEPNVSGRILQQIADAAVAIGKVQKFRPLWSAEGGFSGPYLRNYGMLATEATWDTDYGTDAALSIGQRRNHLKLSGHAYYAYSEMTSPTVIHL